MGGPGSARSLCRHCDRRVRASASGKAVVPSPVSRRSSLDDGDRPQTTRSLAWRPGSDRRQAVDDLSENPPDACSRPPNQLTRLVTPSPAAIAGRAAAPRSPGARLPKLLRSGSLGLAAALATMEKPGLSTADLRFDPIVISGTASTRIQACAVSAQREAVASGDEMLVGAAKEVSAGAADHQCCRILTAVRQSRIGRAALLGLVRCTCACARSRHDRFTWEGVRGFRAETFGGTL